MYSQIEKLLKHVCQGNHGLQSVITKVNNFMSNCMERLLHTVVHKLEKNGKVI